MRRFDDHFLKCRLFAMEIVSDATDQQILEDALAAVSLGASPTEQDIVCLKELEDALPNAPHASHASYLQARELSSPSLEAETLYDAVCGVYQHVWTRLKTLMTTLHRRLDPLDRSSEREVVEAFAQVTRHCQAVTDFDIKTGRSLSQEDNDKAPRTELETLLNTVESLLDSHLLLLRINEETYLNLTEGHGKDYRLPITPFTIIGPSNPILDP